MGEWTDEQRAVIERGVGSTVVVAAPGSGKTSVLTEHITTVVRQVHLDPTRVMAVTFTRQAADHMRQKLHKDSGLSFRAVESLKIGTFHAQMFRSLLTRTPDIPVILNGREQEMMMHHALGAVSRNKRTRQHVVEALTAYSRWIGSGGTRWVSRLEKRAFAAYQKLKQTSRRWDYEDILITATESLDASRTLPVFDTLDYLLIDEFQDTNELQWRLVDRLHESFGIPIFVVGDDDQSVYGFRGSSPVYLQRACLQLKSSRSFLLTRNFRSDRDIVVHASNLIHHVEHRVAKPLRAVSPLPGFVRAYLIKNDLEEARIIAEIVRSISQRQPSWTIGILARTRNQLHNVWKVLSRAEGTHFLPEKQYQFRTFHDGKGREWDVVLMVDAVEAVRARQISSTTTEIDEERRLFYVALTRAKHLFFAFVPARLKGHKVSPSRFLSDAQITTKHWSNGILDEEVMDMFSE